MYFVVTLVIVYFAAICSAGQQSVGVRGRLVCGEEPLKDAKIRLINKKTLGFDDQLAETKTDSDGKYSISGSYGQLLSLDVKMKIYTKCGKSVPVRIVKLSVIFC
ncbi:hypothetical protein AB6A40_010252 [Gnathostoma spinigerum]|uniref:Transthyretin-like family protein n=1 Tax=Gnathostoma spinigerum TaxID=75299 RepID=A0ABD6EUB2_9BILA